MFISISDGIRPAYVIIGSGRGIIKATQQAISRVHIRPEKRYQPKWIKLDIVKDVYSVDGANFNKPLKLERSIQGIAFDEESGITFLPEELVAYTLVDSKRKIQSHNRIDYLG